MFAALVFERDPIEVGDLPRELAEWAQNFGGVAVFFLIGFVLLYLLGAVRFDRERVPSWLSALFTGGVVCCLACYAVWFLLPALATGKLARLQALRPSFLTAAGALALLTCSLPLFANLARLRWRRVYALAKLSFKEAIRRRVLWVFSLLLLVFLFAAWFVPHKPQDQVRTYDGLVYFSMTALLLFAAVVLASFSIPADVRNQTIHTVLTKPVERFEVVLGRTLGYVALMSLVLAVVTAVSLLYVLRGIDPEAAAESLKAREPLFGSLVFHGTRDEHKGDSVGREWDYRGYITLPASRQQQEAVYTFPAVPESVARRDTVRCEHTFVIYRTHKGKEARGVTCAFIFSTWRFHPGQLRGYQNRRDDLLAAVRAGDAERVSTLTEGMPRRDELLAAVRAGKTGADAKKAEALVYNALAEEYGYYEVPAREVTDGQTQWLDVPGGLFRNALDGGKAAGRQDAVTVTVQCRDNTQYVGMARYDLYFRLDDPSGKGDTLRFAYNFFKGTAGLWFRLALVITVAVALSTYLSGVISLLMTLLLYLGGLSLDFIRSVAEGKNVGGGPWESLYRLAQRQSIGAPTGTSSTALAAVRSDDVARWIINRVMMIIPDVDRFDLTTFVAEGFNIGAGHLLVSLVLLGLYLFPWALLAFYLMKWREIASST